MEMITTIDERMSEQATAEAIMPARATALTGERELRKRVWSLAGPVIGENFLETLLGSVDTVMDDQVSSIVHCLSLKAHSRKAQRDSERPHRHMHALDASGRVRAAQGGAH